AVAPDASCPRVPVAEMREALLDPPVVAARDDGGAQPPLLGGFEVVVDAGPQVLEVDQLVVPRTAARAQRLVVEVLPQELAEVRRRIERRPDGPDLGRPLVERQLVPVLAGDLPPAAPARRLRV